MAASGWVLSRNSARAAATDEAADASWPSGRDGRRGTRRPWHWRCRPPPPSGREGAGQAPHFGSAAAPAITRGRPPGHAECHPRWRVWPARTRPVAPCSRLAPACSTRQGPQQMRRAYTLKNETKQGVRACGQAEVRRILESNWRAEAKMRGTRERVLSLSL